ncbi:MAG: metallophosphoesterase [Bryobacteraceae bacterium]|nr:metallophosphoesterase [Bryobacteraceae bacterium]MDW8378751.1 metallophosphoesterase [Bryobacterales bacterium]
MKLLVFSDIHNDLSALHRLMDIEADYYVAAGDLVSWTRGLDQVGPVLARRQDRMFVLPGNHESVEDIERLCQRYGLQNFHGASFQIGGFHVAGLGYSCPTPFHTPGEYSERELSARLQAFATLQPLILICHCPPKGTLLDRVGDGLHYGSTAIKRFIDEHQPAYFFCGHIHEAEGVRTTLGPTTAVNVGKRGFLLELSAAQPASTKP